jgi:hypothetical protein
MLLGEWLFRFAHAVRWWPMPARIFWHIKAIEFRRVLALIEGRSPSVSLVEVLGLKRVPEGNAYSSEERPAEMNESMSSSHTGAHKAAGLPAGAGKPE